MDLLGALAQNLDRGPNYILAGYGHRYLTASPQAQASEDDRHCRDEGVNLSRLSHLKDN
jgi:hypothetical protein